MTEPAAGTTPAGSGDELRRELDRRLEVLTASGYDDPARHGLAPRDWLAIVAFLAAICLGAFAWGY
jgi:hypothetical protein